MALQVGAMKGNLIMSIPVKYVLYNRDYDHHFSGNLFIYLFIYFYLFIYLFIQQSSFID